LAPSISITFARLAASRTKVCRAVQKRWE